MCRYKYTRVKFILGIGTENRRDEIVSLRELGLPNGTDVDSIDLIDKAVEKELLKRNGGHGGCFFSLMR